ncbi:helix-turn-helix transcriptional regulator [Natronosporangium hydrolyticum]|uniref:Helix-turn-helix transcriptional regulator n=1 Tax=Natronosporangium hydrolyticum TaxID=2811111 RepID=A0A895YEN8_9ACTN|nr:helix-turn-helix transcriptional regulator [Natronosporangium hydrolyticum]QSB16267.1 helix-turn-helix transcriptional regulator [Natronosporangium hydrolyticum]
MTAPAASNEPPAPVTEPIGPLLTTLRLARGLSQLRVAEQLCAAAGVATVSRHEVSRWERGERVPGTFWLGWLAAVLEAPVEELEQAVALTRAGEQRSAHPAEWTPELLWHPPTATELRRALDRDGAQDLRTMAHAWLAGPPEQPRETLTLVPSPTTTHLLDARTQRLAELRRMDDLVGGVDLAPLVHQEVHESISVLTTVGNGQPRRRALSLLGEYAQLAGWVFADAGDPGAARRAYRVALRAAAAAADRLLAGYVLAGLSHLTLEDGDPQEALLLARTAQTGLGADATALTRALLLHRVALAAARSGDRRGAHSALRAADRAARSGTSEPEPTWLYWLDQAELTAMTGRALMALGRPLRALDQLTAAGGRRGPRGAALYECWMARGYLQVGEYEQAGRLARRAFRNAVTAGSHRAAALLRRLHPMLLRHRDLPTVRAYERVTEGYHGLLPSAGPASSGEEANPVG